MTADISAFESAAATIRDAATRIAASGTLDDEARGRIGRACDTLHAALDVLTEFRAEPDITDE